MNPSISPPPAQRSLPGNIPHIPPPPPPETSQPHNPMGSSLSFLKTILIPLLISLALYLTLTYALLPLYRRHRARYAQYLPLHTLSTQTSSVRTRLSRTLTSFLLPSSWQRRWNGRRASDSDDGLFDDEEGEGMVGFEVDAGRREALERDAAVRGEGGADERRLSRDLEEGFRDDSDDDQGHDQRSLTTGR